MPSLEWFKNETRLRAAHDFRNRVAIIDRALASYHKVAPSRFGECLGRLEQIRGACQAYLQYPGKKAKRQDGVRKLLDQVEAEIGIFQALVDSQQANGLVDKFRHAVRAQDLAVSAEAKKYEVRKVLNFTGRHLESVIKELYKQDNAKQLEQLLVQEDLDRLNDLIETDETPEIIRNILAEILANRGKVDLKVGPPGATVDLRRGEVPGGPYIVNHALSQRLGTGERLGSLAHELTHVSAGESYRNTIALLLFDPTLNIEEVRNLANQRVRNVDELEELCERDWTFSAEQKDLIRGKLAYAKDTKVMSYSAKYSDAARNIKEKYKGKEQEVMSKDPNDRARKEYEKGQLFKDIADNLKKLGEQVPHNSVLIEYDSVINQVLLYMYWWRIPDQNPFYSRLRQIAQEAFEARRQARERNMTQPIQ